MKKLLLILLFSTSAILAIPERSILFFNGDIFMVYKNNPLLEIQDILKEEIISVEDNEMHPLIKVGRKIQMISQEIGKKNNAIMVLPYTTRGFCYELAYFDPACDITNSIVQLLNNQYLKNRN